MSPQTIVTAYSCGAIAWQFIETQLMIERIKGDKKHVVSRAMRSLGKYADRKGKVWGSALKVFGGTGIALLAFIPVLLASFLWPVTIPVYILANIEWEKLFGRK
ncbi:hypothetical protein Q6670_004009 [Salmonella enterica]|nr:hypothetical protein [Salmonella enterica]